MRWTRDATAGIPTSQANPVLDLTAGPRTLPTAESGISMTLKALPTGDGLAFVGATPQGALINTSEPIFAANVRGSTSAALARDVACTQYQTTTCISNASSCGRRLSTLWIRQCNCHNSLACISIPGPACRSITCRKPWLASNPA
jgi:hypothetical protein